MFRTPPAGKAGPSNEHPAGKAGPSNVPPARAAKVNAISRMQSMNKQGRKLKMVSTTNDNQEVIVPVTVHNDRFGSSEPIDALITINNPPSHANSVLTVNNDPFTNGVVNLPVNVPANNGQKINRATTVNNVDEIRSVVSRRTYSVSSQSRASHLSRARSEITIIDRQKQIEEAQFEKARQSQQEIDDYECQMMQNLMEKKRQQMINRKNQEEAHLEKIKLLDQQRAQKVLLLEEEQDLGDIYTDLQNEAPQNTQFVHDWLNRNETTNVYNQPHQQQQYRNEQRSGINTGYAAPLQRTASAPVQNRDVQTNEVLLAAFKTLQMRQIKDLPTFTGDNMLDWPYFLSEYQRTTQENNISNADNLIRIQKALGGVARATVQPLLNNPCNINRILHILAINFGQTKWIMSKLIQKIQNHPIVAENDVESMKLFYNQVYGLTHTAKTLKGEAYIQSPLLLVSLVDKLPPWCKIKWYEYDSQCSETNILVTLDMFLVWLEKMLMITYSSFNPLQYKNKRIPERRNVMSHQAFDRSLTRCLHCKAKDHYHLGNCEKFKRLNIDERRSTARNLHICFNCLEPGHGSKQCRKENKCTACGAKHNKLLHKDLKPPVQLINFEQEYDEVSEDEEEIVPEEKFILDSEVPSEKVVDTESEPENVFANFNFNNVILRVGRVQLHGPSGTISTIALFDEGSQSTMIDDSLAKELKLNGILSPITYRWTGQMVKHHPNSKKVDLQISCINPSSKKYQLSQVRTIGNLALPPQKFDIKQIQKIYPNIDIRKLENIYDQVPQILIGSDHASLIVPRKSYSYQDGGLQLSRCCLGWTIHGPIHPKSVCSDATLSILVTSTMKQDENLEKLITEQYKVENFGIVNQSPTMSKDDKRAVEIMERTLKKIDDRYEIGLPYRYENIKFPESKSAAMKRLTFIERKMDQDAGYAASYCAKIQDYIEKGYARKLKPNEVRESDKSMYHSHFGVYNIHKPGKFRLVFDLKAKLQGVSFNDLLLKGPDFVPDLVSVLWRGRLRKVGFIADITEMFHQIAIREEDRCSQRFLFRGMNRTGDADVHEMMRMMFGAVSSPSQAQFVKNKNAELLEEKYPGIARAIRKQHYVDDYVDCADNISEAIERIEAVVNAHKEGGFKLVKFVSNSPEVIESLPAEIRGEPAKDGVERVLGLLWDTNTDEYIVSFKIPALNKYCEAKTLTKRELLRALMSVFDPLGVAQPIMVKLKILFQRLWRKKMSWDEQVTLEVYNGWRQWISEGLEMQEIRIPRYYFPSVDKFSVVDLHIFCDASDKAYCAVAYLVVKSNGENFVSFIQAKSKVAPIKHLTVPRMELQACVLGSELARTINEELSIPIVNKHFWTDSKIALHWFSTNEKLNAFTGARVTKIFDKEDITIDNWKWIPSGYNVADLATKEQKLDMKRWLNGPDFLKLDESMWPKFEVPALTQEELVCFHEEIIDQMFVGVFEVAQDFHLPDVERFSNFNRLIRATAYALKMFEAITSSKEEKPSKAELFNISVENMEEAKQYWYRKVQAEKYGDEIMDLMSQGFVKQKSALFTHSPFLHNGILRLQGRVQDPLLTFEENNPVILPGKHRFTYLLMHEYHKRNNHCGTGTVINELRQYYDIIGVKVQVRKIFANCSICRKLRAKPRTPRMGELPIERVTPFVHAFQNVGLDYIGPFMVTVGRRHEKRWLALFNDMVSRGCHIEVVHSLTTDSAIKALMRFANIRGIPSLILSDNATCFKGSDNELKNFYSTLQEDETDICDKLSLKNMVWKFIPPGSPHFGGFYERKVQSIKRGLAAALKDVYPKEETFITVLSDVVNSVNNTPIGELLSDATEARALCPNDLILGRNNSVAINVPINLARINENTWKAAQLIADRFWKRYLKEIRPLMQRRTKWHNDRGVVQLQVNDVVIIVDENLKRNVWPQGVVTETHPGKDTRIRAVTVKTATGEFKRSVMKIVLIHRPSLGVENVNRSGHGEK